MSVLELPTPRVYLPLIEAARYKGAHGGRGSGKSHFFAELMIERHTCEKLDSVCVREVQKSLKLSVKKLLENKIKQMGVGSHFDVQETLIKDKNGGLIIFQGMQDHTAESIKSLEDFDVAWIEEAQSLSQRSLDMLRPTIRKDGSEIWASWNPRNATDPIEQLLRSAKPPPGAVVIEANFKDNPFFPSVLKDEMEYDRSRDPDKYSHIWLGQHQKNSQARVFTNWRVEEFEAPVGTSFRLGADWGFSVDPSVLIRCYQQGRTLFFDHEAYMVGCEINNLPALFASVPESEKWFMAADSARPETISYMKQHGYPRIVAATKGPNSVKEGVEFLKSFDIVVHPRCKHLIDELTLYSYQIDKATQQVLPLLSDVNNHCIDAARYALEQLRRADKQKTPVFESPIPIQHHWR